MPIFVIFKKAYFQDQFAYKSDGERERFYRETDCLSACHTEVRSLDSTEVSHRDDWNSTLGAVECCFPGSLAGSWVGSGSEMMAYGYCKRSLKPLTHTTNPSVLYLVLMPNIATVDVLSSHQPLKNEVRTQKYTSLSLAPT